MSKSSNRAIFLFCFSDQGFDEVGEPEGDSEFSTCLFLVLTGIDSDMGDLGVDSLELRPEVPP